MICESTTSGSNSCQYQFVSCTHSSTIRHHYNIIGSCRNLPVKLRHQFTIFEIITIFLRITWKLFQPSIDPHHLDGPRSQSCTIVSVSLSTVLIADSVWSNNIFHWQVFWVTCASDYMYCNPRHYGTIKFFPMHSCIYSSLISPFIPAWFSNGSIIR
jgi:hypothetical protein